MSSVATSPTNATTPGIRLVTPHAARAKASHTPRPAGTSRGWDRSPAAIHAVTPHGYQPARNEGQWLGHLKDNPVIASMYQPRWKKTMRLARTIIQLHQRKTSTLCITHKTLCETTGFSPDFIKRTLRVFKAQHLIAVVASGRSARCAPKGRPAENLAPVYLLLTPTDQADSSRDHGVVDEIARPSSVSLSSPSFNRDWHNLSTEQRCQRAFANRYKDPRTQWWPKHCSAPTPETTDAAEIREITTRMALTIQRETLELRKMTLKSLTRMLTLYFRTGWTVSDVLIALERRADGTAWDTNGAGGMKSIRAWLRTRLNAWTTPRGPMEPASIQAQRRHEKLTAAQARADTETTQHLLKAGASKHSPARVTVRRMAAIIRCGSEQAARHQHPELFTA